ncbi:MAG: bifunctional riboflavin kinase/FAD synthetase [Gemmatimonadaceae bacterium]|nr:bifunctional riboflavin kinase/FAD synthetase [Gloeobacterales cyanobacterium ES-bin-141]
MRIFSSLAQVTTPCDVALGNFDGVHLGHQAVIRTVLERSGGGTPTVLTFEPHPREFFSGRTGFLLTPRAQKLEQIKSLGIEQVVVLPFDADLARMNALSFVVEVLQGGLQAKFVSVGWNFRFGKGREGTTEMLEQFAQQNGLALEVIAEQRLAGQPVSSSVIREALSRGEVERASRLLGYAYSLEGEVVPGDRRGRSLGFPTANVQVDTRKFLPADGVYLVQVTWDTLTRWGLLNIGVRPTFAGRTRSVEVHLLDWDDDLYGRHLRLTLLYYLRPERQFGGIEELRAQLEQDRIRALTLIQ